MSVILKTKGELRYFAAEGISVPHCFTTRLGGVSKGSLSSMNIGTSRGDSRENVLKNYEILGTALGFNPHKVVLSRQCHSDIVQVVDGKQAGAGLFTEHLPDCDALVTTRARPFSLVTRASQSGRCSVKSPAPACFPSTT